MTTNSHMTSHRGPLTPNELEIPRVLSRARSFLHLMIAMLLNKNLHPLLDSMTASITFPHAPAFVGLFKKPRTTLLYILQWM